MFPSYAAVGLGVATGGGVRSRHGSHPRTGWTAPTVIWEKMKLIQTRAAALDGDVSRFVIRPVFKENWSAWYKRWSEFFTKYQSDMNRLGALTFTDELNAQTDAYFKDLEGWYAGYSRETDQGGKPVPPPTAPPPNAPEVPDKPEDKRPSDGISIWWFVGGAMVLGIGYMMYKNLKAANETARAIAPALVGGMVNPAGTAVLAASHSAHDPGGMVLGGGPVHVVRDPGPPMGYLPPHYRMMPVPYGR